LPAQPLNTLLVPQIRPRYRAAGPAPRSGRGGPGLTYL